VQMKEWKQQLNNFDSLFEELGQRRVEGGRYRFGRSVVVASDIAEQFYCEKKVEMQYLNGETETGREEHWHLSIHLNRQKLFNYF